MSEENQPDQNREKPDGSQGNGSLGYLRGVCIAATWAFIGLLLTAIFLPNLAERTKFFTGNLFNLVIAFAVIAQVIVYRKQTQIMTRQLKATESAAKTAEQALYIAERPYLDISSLKVLPYPLVPHTPITYSARIENMGRTPAYETTGAIYIQISEDRLSDDPEYMPLGRPKSKSNLGPGRHQTFFRVTPDLDLEPAEVAQIENGTRFLYVYGVIEYKDGFTPRVHRLRYCQAYDHILKKMVVTNFHNDSD